jgi:outer membrane protein OmpA-like peptidoglycan-associated protein
LKDRALHFFLASDILTPEEPAALAINVLQRRLTVKRAHKLVLPGVALAALLSLFFMSCGQSGVMEDELNKSGFVTLHINFETGKSDIKPESQTIIDQVADMLKANDSLNVSIEGHTDNVGTPAFNKTLSENRAKSVMNAIIARGIEKSRLSAKGWGQEKPIGDNKTEEGRAKNRRVEIVKK